MLQNLWITPEPMTMARVLTEINSLADSIHNPGIDISLWNTNGETLDLSGASIGEGPAIYWLTRTMQSSEYAVFDVLNWGDEEYTGLSLEYTQFCPTESTQVNPMLVEFWFLRYLQPTGLVPDAYAISAPVPIVWDERGPAVRGMEGRNRLAGKLVLKSCSTTLPEIRYILREETQKRLVPLGFVVSGSNLSRTIQYGLEMVEFVRQLHDRGVIHGNIQVDSFLTNAFTGSIEKVVDFRSARYYNEEETSAIKPACQLRATELDRSTWLSTWNKRKCIVSFRDDIYRIVFILAALIDRSYRNPKFDQLISIDVWNEPWMEEEESDSTDDQVNEKQNTILLLNGLFNLESLTGPHATDMRRIFTQLSSHVLSMHVTQRPNHSGISQRLEDIYRLAVRAT